MKHNKIIEISNRNELITYLKQEGNSYSNFILERIDRSSIEKKGNYAVTALTRILSGHIDQRTGKKLFSFNEWRVLGINCFIE